MAVIATKVGGVIFFSSIATGRLSMRATLIKLSEKEKKKKQKKTGRTHFGKVKGFRGERKGLREGNWG